MILVPPGNIVSETWRSIPIWFLKWQSLQQALINPGFPILPQACTLGWGCPVFVLHTDVSWRPSSASLWWQCNPCPCTSFCSRPLAPTGIQLGIGPTWTNSVGIPRGGAQWCVFKAPRFVTMFPPHTHIDAVSSVLGTHAALHLPNVRPASPD